MISDPENNNEIIKSFGTILVNNPLVLEESKKFSSITVKLDFNLPKNFDGRKIWKPFINPYVRNQGSCGNCYAQATCDMLENRFRIQTFGKVSINGHLSATQMTICEYQRDTDWIKFQNDLKKQQLEAIKGHSIGACNGNTLYNAIDFLYRYGIPDSQCIDTKKYNNWCDQQDPKCEALGGNDEKLPTCEHLVGIDYDQCLNTGLALRRYRASAIYNVPSNDLAIRSEIYKFGPVSAGFMVYDDFLNDYDGKTIYTYSRGSKLQSGHAIEIYGWGEEEQNGRLIKYWLIKNSWSDKWGDGGFFKMERGIPEFQLEQNVVALIPDIPYLIIKCMPPQIKFLQVSKDDVKREEFNIDQSTGYRKITLEKIRNGILKGSLKPIVKIEDVPDFCSFVAGMMASNPDAENETEELYETGDNKQTKKVIYAILVLIAIGVIVYKFRK